jgi:hypothetical protein
LGTINLKCGGDDTTVVTAGRRRYESDLYT